MTARIGIGKDEDVNENDRWIEDWLDRWAGLLASLVILFGAGALVVGWLHGGVL